MSTLIIIPFLSLLTCNVPLKVLCHCASSSSLNFFLIPPFLHLPFFSSSSSPFFLIPPFLSPSSLSSSFFPFFLIPPFLNPPPFLPSPLFSSSSHLSGQDFGEEENKVLSCHLFYLRQVHNGQLRLQKSPHLAHTKRLDQNHHRPFHIFMLHPHSFLYQQGPAALAFSSLAALCVTLSVWKSKGVGRRSKEGRKKEGEACF